MNIAYFLNIEPLAWLGIASAMLAGFIIGIERQVYGKPAGVRTSILICFGTYIFVAVAKSMVAPETTHIRIIGQVIPGIGFLGAGVIITRNEIVSGVTTAATIWVLAAIGCVIGIGHYLTGIKLAVLCVFVLFGINKLESTFVLFQKGVYQKIFKKKE